MRSEEALKLAREALVKLSEKPSVFDRSRAGIAAAMGERRKIAEDALACFDAALASHAGAAVQQEPIDMVLHCPACGMQHVDAPQDHPLDPWLNPPHRSHLCKGCGHIWRPADVPTNGVAAVKTRGKADSPIAPGAVQPPRKPDWELRLEGAEAFAEAYGEQDDAGREGREPLSEATIDEWVLPGEVRAQGDYACILWAIRKTEQSHGIHSIAEPGKNWEHCKHAQGGAKCVSHCGDPICLNQKP